MDDLPTSILGARQYLVSHAPVILAPTSPSPADLAAVSTSTSPSEPSATTTASTSKSGLSTAQKVGIGIGTAGFVLIVAIAIFVLFRRRRRKATDAERGRKKSKSGIRAGGKRKKKQAVDRQSISEPKLVHSPSTIKSSPGRAGSPAPSPPRSPPPIRPKSSKRPPSLPIIPNVSLDESKLGSPKTPDVPEKSARRRTLLLEDDEGQRPQTAPAAPQSTPTDQTTPLFSDDSRSPGDPSLRPLPLFSPVPDLRRISEDSGERSGNRTPEVPAKAAARVSIVSETTNIDESGNTVDEVEIAALKAENDRLRRETLRLREMVGEGSGDESSERGKHVEP